MAPGLQDLDLCALLMSFVPCSHILGDLLMEWELFRKGSGGTFSFMALLEIGFTLRGRFLFISQGRDKGPQSPVLLTAPHSWKA